jgi:hypothetical protein
MVSSLFAASSSGCLFSVICKLQQTDAGAPLKAEPAAAATHGGVPPHGRTFFCGAEV